MLISISLNNSTVWGLSKVQKFELTQTRTRTRTRRFWTLCNAYYEAVFYGGSRSSHRCCGWGA